MYNDQLLLGPDEKQKMKPSARENDVLKTTVNERCGKAPSGFT